MSYFNKYLKGLFNSIPEHVYVIVIISFTLGLILFIAIKGLRKGFEAGVRLLLADYIFIVLCSTVLSRKIKAVTRCDFTPFRTYHELFNGNTAFLLSQSFMNILVFIPIGLLLKVSFSSWKLWQLLLIGCGLSMIIEISQLVLHRGFCEIDDVMHNGLGCLIGIMLFHAISKIRVTQWGMWKPNCTKLQN